MCFLRLCACLRLYLQTFMKLKMSVMLDQIGKFENISTVSRQRTEKRELEKDKRTKIKQEKIAGRILKLNGLMGNFLLLDLQID